MVVCCAPRDGKPPPYWKFDPWAALDEKRSRTLDDRPDFMSQLKRAYPPPKEMQ